MLTNFSYLRPRQIAGSAHPDSMGRCSESLRELRREGIEAIVSLDEDGIPVDQIAEFGFVHLHIPIPDFHPPTLQQAEQFVAFANDQHAANRPLVVHCRAGYGRTGTMLACWLVSQGSTADAAIKEVRRRRPGSVETHEQEQFVATFENYLRATEPALNRRSTPRTHKT